MLQIFETSETSGISFNNGTGLSWLVLFKVIRYLGAKWKYMMYSIKVQLKFVEVKIFEEFEFIQVSSQNYIGESQ